MAREHDQSTGASSTAAHFATTHWNLVFSAGHGGSNEAREAMADLCRIYWYPLYAYARCQGATADAAQDLTQGFFAHLLAHDLVASADAARGRFLSAAVPSELRGQRTRPGQPGEAGRGTTVALAGCAGGRAAIRP
jgi:RNA polymerase sigma-70 factor (ECF subfamily)